MSRPKSKIKQRLHITINEEMFNRLFGYADYYGLSMSYVISESLRLFFNEQAKKDPSYPVYTKQ